ncbi:MAG TPA: hypothetical protein ENJ28_03440 [Gammaproteobacteria bacterium]|nr:hypothetical protein [Gammaproteobacteria bacterium]
MRTKSHNDKVGGKTTRQHLTAKAVDCSPWANSF